MAEVSFPLPDLGEGLLEATVLEWLVKVGDQVERNQPFVEVETTKSSVELPSPISGTVLTLHGEPGDVVLVDTPLITFTVADDSAGIVGTVPAEVAPKRRVRLSAVLDED
ncbi:biotin/lipoyl-containing protein [Cryobacterium sp. PH31-L1]|uniref:biotin/lipoyl-containing protein n=1 Tax=Cryobacterium sp. PH31-L1 TaxID=3046199 RepID=UPI0024B9F154|nr:biotin/lipoyl-containing protein [Cryobacterium sp. PH31-L1]MDJ0377349.1 biotin attachment protein [Cryobacterium sp. PH31-L1]